MGILCQNIKRLGVAYSSTEVIEHKCALIMTGKDASAVVSFLHETMRT